MFLHRFAFCTPALEGTAECRGCAYGARVVACRAHDPFCRISNDAHYPVLRAPGFAPAERSRDINLSWRHYGLPLDGSGKTRLSDRYVSCPRRDVCAMAGSCISDL